MRTLEEFLVQPMLYLVNAEGHPVVFNGHLFAFEDAGDSSECRCVDAFEPVRPERV